MGMLEGDCSKIEAIMSELRVTSTALESKWHVSTRRTFHNANGQRLQSKCLPMGEMRSLIGGEVINMLNKAKGDVFGYGLPMRWGITLHGSQRVKNQPAFRNWRYDLFPLGDVLDDISFFLYEAE